MLNERGVEFRKSFWRIALRQGASARGWWKSSRGPGDCATDNCPCKLAKGPYNPVFREVFAVIL